MGASSTNTSRVADLLIELDRRGHEPLHRQIEGSIRDSIRTGRLRRGMAYGTVLASVTVEGFGLDRLKQTNLKEIDERLEQYRTMLAF